MFLNTVNAEWIKLRSTKSVYWTTALIILFSAGWAVLMGFASGYAYQDAIDSENAADLATLGVAEDVFSVSSALSGLQLFGIMIVIIQAVIFVTGEYGNGTAKLSVLAAPRRWQIPAAKALVYGVIVAVLFAVVSIVSVFLAGVAAKGQLTDASLADGLSLSADGAWTTILLMVLDAVLIVMLSVGVGYLLRRTAGGVALLLLWVLLLEQLIGMIPKVGDWITPYLPFTNMNAGLYQEPVTDAPWGIGGSVVYFTVFCLIVYAAGTVVLRRRDV
ncbi:ABC transporter permease subunit [Corynebacterium terpenotabidum]|uniref:ABC transporter permease n=1 Tax=Corynebacterium terpenotabidum Y-11 TaxID=1200352 RepID=S4XBQ8_9CORY|nr:ABC transporter permease subunit [Corynebacterium terpenotabidum]AGP30011.1 ABC transporter permease [Corynebacterium terpenotabidum Y-11]